MRVINTRTADNSFINGFVINKKLQQLIIQTSLADLLNCFVEEVIIRRQCITYVTLVK